MDAKLSELIRRMESDAPPSRAQIEQCYSDGVDDTLRRIERACRSMDAADFRALDGLIDEIREEIRESVQAITRKEMWDIIVRLREDHDISDADLRLIRLWVVGDAAAYVREEDTFPDWIRELERLGDEIRELREGPVDVDTLEALGALLTDARGVSRSLALYLNDRERVQRFEKTLQGGLDADDRNSLADYLVQAYTSDKV
jgi:hypothetical protein